MQFARPAFAPPPTVFGRGRTRELAVAVAAPSRLSLSDDVKLFATTFAAGFLFVSVLLS